MIQLKIASRFRPATPGRAGRRSRPVGLPGAARLLRAVGLAGAALMLAAFLPSADAGAAVVPWMSLEEMARDAHVIALGRVESVEGAWSEDGRIIVSRVTIAVERSLKGGPRKSLALEVPGGKVDGQIMMASGAPVFAPGERVIVFLSPAGEAGRPGPAPRLAVVGWSQGKLEVRRDPRTGRELVRGRTAGASYLDRQGKPVGPGRLEGGPVELEQFLGTVERLVRGAGGESRP